MQNFVLRLLPIFLYFCFLLYVAWRTARRESLDRDYFLAGRNIHPFFALVSVVATETSVATIIVFPQVGLSSGLALLWLCAGFIVGRYLVARFYLSKLYERHVLSIYATITGNALLARKALSALYLLAKFISSGVRFFMGGLALYQLFGSAHLDLSATQGVILWIGLLAFFAGLYSLTGGLRAVVLTDQLQGYVIVGLGLFLAFFLFFRHGMPALESRDFLQFHFAWTNALYSPVLFLAGLVLTIGSHGADQDMLQRILATKSKEEAKRALFFSGLGATFVIFIYLCIGFLLRQEELAAPQAHYPLVSWISAQAFPLLEGLFAVLLFAAAMSTLDSAMHSTGAIWKDILDGRRTGRSYSFFSLAILALFAAGFSVSHDKDFLKLALGSMNYVNGGLISVLTLYIFSDRPVGLCSIVAAMLAGFFVTLFCNVFPLVPGPKEPLYLGWSYVTLFSTASALLAGWLFHYKKEASESQRSG